MNSLFILSFIFQFSAIRSRLNIALAPLWTALDLHRFVAHYLTVRFPICLALNKIDAFPDSTVKNGITDIILKKNDNTEKNDNNEKKNDNNEKNDKTNKISSSECTVKNTSATIGREVEQDTNHNHIKMKNDKIIADEGAYVPSCTDKEEIVDLKKLSHSHVVNDNGRGIVELCQHQAMERGELAVPVSAFADNWVILKQMQVQMQVQMHTQMHTLMHTQMQTQIQTQSLIQLSSYKNIIPTPTVFGQPNILIDFEERERERERVTVRVCDRKGDEELTDKMIKNSKIDSNLDVGEESDEDKRKLLCPPMGSKLWNANEIILERVKRIWNTTGFNKHFFCLL